MQNITYVGELPTDVNDCIVIQENGGPHGTYFNSQQLDRPYIHLYVRNSNYAAGYQCIHICKKLLASYADAVMSLVLIGDIKYLGRDDARRSTFQLIFKTIYKE